MKNGFAQFVAVMTALCLVVQSVGAAIGGFVCIGCPNTEAGISLSSAPCNSIDSCCWDLRALDELAAQCADDCADHEQHGTDQNCGCVDISIPASAGAMWSAAVKDSLTFTAYINVLATSISLDAHVETSPRLMWTARGKPPIVWSLAPSLRRTVLLI